MKRQVVFTLDQDLGPDDLTGIEEATRDTFDSLVKQTVTRGNRYSGFEISASSQTKIGLNPGTLYAVNGATFDTPIAQIEDTYLKLPPAGKRWVTISAYGEELPDNAIPREFLIDEATGASQGKPVVTMKRRLANVKFSYGEPAPSPTKPDGGIGYVLIGWVLLNTSGIEEFANSRETQIENMDDLGNRLDAAEAFNTAIGPKIETLSSDLAALARQLANQASSLTLAQILLRVATLEAKANIPATAAASRACYFLDRRDSNLGHVLSRCRVDEGIRFPYANQGYSKLVLDNPLNPGAQVINGLLLPAYNRKLWLATGNKADQIRLSAFSYQTNEFVQRTMSRKVTEYGPEKTVCSNSAFWKTGQYNVSLNKFVRNGETYQVNASFVDYASGRNVHQYIRVQQYWETTVTENYTDEIVTPHTVAGTMIAETFLQGQDIWLEAIGVMFTQLADAGDVTIVVGLVDPRNGLPDPTSVISMTTLAREKMVANAETVVPIVPTFLQAGNRYYVKLVTAADHWAATVPGESFTQGTLFTFLDGAYAQGDGTKDLWLRLYRAVPKQARTSIEFKPLQLDGGILGIRTNFDQITPESCGLALEIMIDGYWYALEDVDAYMLGQGGSIPATLRFRGTFIGTADMMPAVRLDNSEIEVSRIAKSFLHVGEPFNVGFPTTQVRVIARYENWHGSDAAAHTAVVKLRTGGTLAGGSASYNTVVSANSFTDVLGTDPLYGPYLERTYVFNLGASITSFCCQDEGTTATELVPFHTAHRKDYEL